MLKTMKGSEDGFTVKVFEKGKTYDTNPDLADVFLDNKWAEPAKELEDETDLPEPNSPTSPEDSDGILSAKPSTWPGATLVNKEDPEEVVVVEKVAGSQVFFEGEVEALDYRTVRKNFIEKR
jgi:hypothetical protein